MYPPHPDAQSRPPERTPVWLIVALERLPDFAGRADPIGPAPDRGAAYEPPGPRDRLRTICRFVALFGLIWAGLTALVLWDAGETGVSESFEAVIFSLTAVGAGVALLGLVRAGLCLRDRFWTRSGAVLRESLAWVAGGAAGAATALVLSLLSASGQIPVP